MNPEKRIEFSEAKSVEEYNKVREKYQEDVNRVAELLKEGKIDSFLLIGSTVEGTQDVGGKSAVKVNAIQFGVGNPFLTALALKDALEKNPDGPIAQIIKIAQSGESILGE